MGFSLAIYGIILYYSIVSGRNAYLDKFKKMYKQKERKVKMIRKVTIHTLYGKNGKTYQVIRAYYPNKDRIKSDIVRQYNENDMLPKTIVEFILNAGKVETTYIPENGYCTRTMRGGKKEVYTK